MMTERKKAMLIAQLLEQDDNMTVFRASEIIQERAWKEQQEEERLKELERLKGAYVDVVEASPGKPGEWSSTLWDHSELFKVNLRVMYPVGYPPGGEWSVGYIISRKLKRIVGCEGGGWLPLEFNKQGGMMSFPPATNDNNKDIKAHLASKAMADYLAKLP